MERSRQIGEDRVSCSPGWPQSLWVAEDDPELHLLMPELQAWISRLVLRGTRASYLLRQTVLPALASILF